MLSASKGLKIKVDVSMKVLISFVFLGFFMHIGFSYYASICTLLFIFVLIHSYPKFSSVLTLSHTVLSLAIFGSIFLIPLLINDSVQTLDLLRYSRDVFFAVTCLSILNYSRTSSRFEISRESLAKAHKFLTFAIVASAFLIVFQYVAIRSGTLLEAIPIEFFGRNYETLADSKSFGLRTRPTGTFGEPSYFALYLLFLSLAKNELQKLLPSRDFHFALFFSAVAFLLLESGLGILALAFVLLLSESKKRVFILSIVFVTSLFFLLLGSNSIFLSRAFSSDSWNERVGLSFEKLINYWQVNPLGFPPRKLFGLESILLEDQRTGLFLNNGLAYFLYAYGILGLGIVMWFAYVLSKSQISVQVFCFFLLFQNGSFLDFDKLALLMMFVLFSKIRPILEMATNASANPRGIKIRYSS
jgi:hypothetical protein